MPSDLTERLAERLGAFTPMPRSIAMDAAKILPLLLSEPELVASLPEEVRQDLLGRLLGEAKNLDELCDIWNKAIKRFEEPIDPEEERLSVLSARERAVMKLGEAAWRWRQVDDEIGSSDGFPDPPIPDGPLDRAQRNYLAALAEVQALTPEVTP